MKGLSARRRVYNTTMKGLLYLCAGITCAGAALPTYRERNAPPILPKG